MAIGTLAACQAPDRESQTAPAAADIPVGVYAALSGSEAAFGQATLQGVRLAADEINAAGGLLGGRKIRLIVEDTRGKAEEAAAVVTKLVTGDSVVTVIGENSSNQSLAAAPICQLNK